MKRKGHFISGDAIIARCPASGPPAIYMQRTDRMLKVDDLDLMSPAFAWRVRDAMRRLRRGDSCEEIRALHGCVVLRTAEDLRTAEVRK